MTIEGDEPRYDPHTIVDKWLPVWDELHVHEPVDDDSLKRRYVVDMFSYPSGDLHMGHAEAFSIGDAVARYAMMCGYDVLHPIGWDSFGLPAENAALKRGQDPREWTYKNIETQAESFKRLGISIDWRTRLHTSDPEYYRWTQWLFLRMYERGLAYRKSAPVNWCPVDQTVLANEQVIAGNCERCGTPVTKRNLTQWFFRITAYAERLLDDMALLEGKWPDRVLTMQRNWIGKSTGAHVDFRIEGHEVPIRVFTTRPDTLFGATFFVIAADSPLAAELCSEDNREEFAAYVEQVRKATEIERLSEGREKTGVPLGRVAINPINGEHIPVFAADYVLADYGTGAIMAVPAHDQRDLDFARAFDLPVRVVVDTGQPDPNETGLATAGDGVLVNSGSYDGKRKEEAIPAIAADLQRDGHGEAAVTYRLRDWLLSRQRYWGCPIPIVHCDECGIVPVPEDELPVVLPEIDDYLPKGRSPLATAEEWVRVDCPRCGREARRETDTMDTFVDSSWYFMRYCDARNETAPFERELVDYWLPIDQYIGGVEHAILHLLYARFFVKVLNDMGLVGFREPFARLFTQGMVYYRGAKMSKSRGNVVDPQPFIERFGADVVRLWCPFLGPVDQDAEWHEDGMEGMSRFLHKLWRVTLAAAERPPSARVDTPLSRKTHRTIAKVSDDIGRRFVMNTPIAAVMELVNEIGRAPDDAAVRFAAETAVSLIQPYAPHIAEELWRRLGHEALWVAPWPEADPALLQTDTFELVVQVNGRVRDRMEVAADLSEAELVARATASPKVQAQLDGGQIRQTIVVPRKLVNIVVA
ncbi:MAG: leucine--tRNA ligase [Actinobacteria bacterium]|nr:MAG: leucine--tRNA ligase [Actinomycetota bacterium]